MKRGGGRREKKRKDEGKGREGGEGKSRITEGENVRRGDRRR